MPVPDEARLLERLGKFTCCWETEVPAAEDYPAVPVKLKSNVLTEPLTTITEMYSLPAYDGVDPNGLMAPFYIFFFGFMFADLGYGLILAGACAFLQWKVKPKGGFGQLVRLMILCGISSAVIGLLTGGFFSDFLYQFTSMLGLPQPAVPFLSVPEGSGLPAPLLDVMNEPMTVLIFSLAVGLVQIVVGMAVKFWMLCRDGQIMDAVWDVGTWWVIFIGIGLFAVNMAGISGIGSVNGIPVVLIVGCVMLLAQGRNAKGFGKVTAVIGAVYNGVTRLLRGYPLLFPPDGHDAGGFRHRSGVQYLGRHARRRPAPCDRDPHFLPGLPRRPRIQHWPERDRHLCAHVPPAISGVF